MVKYLRFVDKFLLTLSGIIYPFKVILKLALVTRSESVLYSVTVENESTTALNLNLFWSPQYALEAYWIASITLFICST